MWNNLDYFKISIKNLNSGTLSFNYAKCALFFLSNIRLKFDTWSSCTGNGKSITGKVPANYQLTAHLHNCASTRVSLYTKSNDQKGLQPLYHISYLILRWVMNIEHKHDLLGWLVPVRFRSSLSSPKVKCLPCDNSIAQLVTVFRTWSNGLIEIRIRYEQDELLWGKFTVLCRPEIYGLSFETWKCFMQNMSSIFPHFLFIFSTPKSKLDKSTSPTTHNSSWR